MGVQFNSSSHLVAVVLVEGLRVGEGIRSHPSPLNRTRGWNPLDGKVVVQVGRADGPCWEPCSGATEMCSIVMIVALVDGDGDMRTARGDADGVHLPASDRHHGVVVRVNNLTGEWHWLKHFPDDLRVARADGRRKHLEEAGAVEAERVGLVSWGGVGDRVSDVVHLGGTDESHVFGRLGTKGIWIFIWMCLEDHPSPESRQPLSGTI